MVGSCIAWVSYHAAEDDGASNVGAALVVSGLGESEFAIRPVERSDDNGPPVLNDNGDPIMDK